MFHRRAVLILPFPFNRLMLIPNPADLLSPPSFSLALGSWQRPDNEWEFLPYGEGGCSEQVFSEALNIALKRTCFMCLPQKPIPA